MEFTLPAYGTTYRIADPGAIMTPRLLVWQERVAGNIDTMREMLQRVRPGADLSLLCPHVKTHKSAWVTRQLMAAGVRRFKATLNEVDMLLACGVKEIFVAYPLPGAQAQWLAQRMAAHRGVQFHVQIAHAAHAAVWTALARQYEFDVSCFLDLDVGMGRTGIAAEKAFELYQAVSPLHGLRFAGLHAYDGHNYQATLDERREITRESMERLLAAMTRFSAHRVAVPRVVVAGTPGFWPDFEYLSTRPLQAELWLSPGTWVLFDTTCGRIMPHTFTPAALILAQVVDQTAPERRTLNLGHKRWAVDQGPVEEFSLPGVRAVKWSEEHTVIEVAADSGLQIGDYLAIVPRHVCSTVNLWEYFTLIGAQGEIIMERCPVEARNR